MVRHAVRVDDRLEGVVTARLLLPGCTDTIVLLDPEHRPEGLCSCHPFPNVARVTVNGSVVWRSELLPQETTAKCWNRITWDGARLLASTYSYVCELDPVTGRIVSETFTK